MRGFAKSFYLSPEWRRVREYVYQRDAGLCVRCGGLGEIVHHKTPLTPGNISDTAIALGESNLELLCRECHGRAHAHASALGEGLAFDESGNVVRLDKRN